MLVEGNLEVALHYGESKVLFLVEIYGHEFKQQHTYPPT